MIGVMLLIIGSNYLINYMNDLRFESQYWGNCTNTFDEEQKHYI
jgi:hypothetical protein